MSITPDPDATIEPVSAVRIPTDDARPVAFVSESGALICPACGQPIPPDTVAPVVQVFSASPLLRIIACASCAVKATVRPGGSQ